MNTPSAFTPHGPGFRFLDAFELHLNRQSGSAKFHLLPSLPFFADHFPGNPIMPAVLLIEHAAQAAGVLWMSLFPPSSQGDTPSSTPLFVASIDVVKVQGPARPDETLTSTVELLKEFGSLAQFEFHIFVENRPVSKGRLTLSRDLKS